MQMTSIWHSEYNKTNNFKDDPLFNSLEKWDRLKTFTDFITVLEIKEKEEKEKNKKYFEYRNRENFREFLQEKIEMNEFESVRSYP